MKFLRGLVFFPMLWLRRLILRIVQMFSRLFALTGFVVLVVSAVTRFNVENQKWWKFAGGSVLSLAYFALLVAFFKPH